MLRYIIWALVIYSLYRLIFHFIIPVFRVSQQMKEKVKEFNNRMESENLQQHDTPQKNKQASKEDYIDYEEVKSNS